MLFSEVRKYPASKKLLKVFLILDDARAHPEPRVQHWGCPSGLLAPKHNSSNSASRSVCRTFKAHYTQYSLERMVSVLEENPPNHRVSPVNHSSRSPLLFPPSLYTSRAALCFCLPKFPLLIRSLPSKNNNKITGFYPKTTQPNWWHVSMSTSVQIILKRVRRRMLHARVFCFLFF